RAAYTLSLHDALPISTIGAQVLLLIQEQGDERYRDRLLGHIDEIKRTFYDYYRIDSSIALSDADGLQHARRMYRDTLACLNHRLDRKSTRLNSSHAKI